MTSHYVRIGSCPLCGAPIERDIARRPFWCVFVSRINRTCACFDAVLGAIEFGLLTNASAVPALMHFTREDGKRDE